MSKLFLNQHFPTVKEFYANGIQGSIETLDELIAIETISLRAKPLNVSKRPPSFNQLRFYGQNNGTYMPLQDLKLGPTSPEYLTAVSCLIQPHTPFVVIVEKQIEKGAWIKYPNGQMRCVTRVRGILKLGKTEKPNYFFWATSCQYSKFVRVLLLPILN